MVVAFVVVAFVVVVGVLISRALARLGLLGALILARMVGGGIGLDQFGGRGDVNDGLGGLLFDGLVYRALESREVDDGVRGSQRVNRLGGELQVVGLGAFGGQGGDGDVFAADLLSQVLQGVEGCHDGQGSVLAGTAPRGSSGGAGGQCERCSGRACGGEDSL